VLDPSAWFETPKSFSVKLRPVGDTPHHPPYVDVIEMVGRKSPRLGEVVELESAVGRNPRGLARCEVYADDGGRGVEVSKVAVFQFPSC